MVLILTIHSCHVLLHDPFVDAFNTPSIAHGGSDASGKPRCIRVITASVRFGDVPTSGHGAPIPPAVSEAHAKTQHTPTTVYRGTSPTVANETRSVTPGKV